MKVHKTKTLADKYECSACNTVFRKEDLKRTYNKPGLGKYVYQPDIEECPFCYADLDMETAQIIERPAPVPRNKEIAGLIKNKYMLEKRIEEANCQRITAETLSVSDKDDGGQPHETNRIMTDTMAQDGGNVGQRSNAQNVILESLITLGQTQARLKAKMGNAPVPIHLPRTIKQNCHSGGVTIRPQVDWLFWDSFIKHSGGLPIKTGG